MNPKKKKVMTAGLVVLSVAIWTPQLIMGVVQPASTDRPDVANGGEFAPAFPGGESGSGGAALQAELIAQPGGESVPMPGAEDAPLPGATDATPHGTRVTDSGTSLKEALQQMEQVTSARGRERVDLDELFGRLEARATSETPGPQLAPREIVRPLPRRDVLGEFARDAQVNAILFDAEDSLALLNGELVRVGDVLPGGVQVSAIARRRVELTLGDEVRSVGLPALRTRPRAAESDEGPGAAPAPVTAAPEAAPQTPEPGPTAHED